MRRAVQLLRDEQAVARGALEVPPALAARALRRHGALRPADAFCGGPGRGRRLPYGFDDAVGRLTCQGATRLERGKGPRHVVFHPTRGRLHRPGALVDGLGLCL